jgi:hypothetical protein
MKAAVVLFAVLLAGCGTTKVVKEREDIACSVDPAGIAPVEMPARLQNPATVEDLFRRQDKLEAAVTEANGRLKDVPKFLRSSAAKPKPEEPAPGLWARIKSWF